MRYKITDGLIDHLKTIVNHVVYVNDVDETFKQYEERISSEQSPYIVSVSRTASVFNPLEYNAFNRKRGRFANRTTEKFDVTTLKGLPVTCEYDITILSYDRYVYDTLLEELVFAMLDKPEFIYEVGAITPNSETEEEATATGIIRFVNDDGLDSFSESVDVPNQGRLYRVSFVIEVDGYIYKQHKAKLVKETKVTVSED